MMQKAAWLMTYGGSGTAFVCSLDLNTVVAVISVLIALTGLFMSWYYAARKDSRELVEHLAREVREAQRAQHEQDKAT